MDWKLFVGLRYFTRRSKEKFVSIISIISILGVIVGVAALIVVLSIMTGFDLEIKERIIGTYSHIVLLKENGIKNEEEAIDILSQNEHIVASSPFIDAQALLWHKDGAVGVLLRGLDEKREPLVSNLKEYTRSGKLSFGTDGVILGKELARNLGLKEGERVKLFSPYMNKQKEFIIVDTFASGRYDYDANLVLTSLESARELFGKGVISGIGVKVDNEFNVNRIKKDLQKVFPYPFLVNSWMDLDRNLMRALAIEKKMMFFILALIIIVACFNIASSLIMQVLEKTKDVGILRAIGATRGNIKTIFIFLGFLIGTFGAFFGTLCGVVIARNINVIAGFLEKITGFTLFPSDIYYLSEIPVKIIPVDVAFIAMFSLALAVAASLYPAWKASRLNPVEAIRYE